MARKSAAYIGEVIMIAASRHVITVMSVLLASASCVSIEDAPASETTFFVTSVGLGRGADLGGLAGADAHCQSLAEAAGHSGRVWRAYLSVSPRDGVSQVDARDRIGAGPWRNAAGVVVADNLAELIPAAPRLNKETALDERGRIVTGRGDTPNRHDILTGTQEDGTAFTLAEDRTCSNWTSSTMGAAQVGHHDRSSPTATPANPSPWATAHPSRGCSLVDLNGSGGDGLFYCFAAR
jgi:hypothetical protein